MSKAKHTADNSAENQQPEEVKVDSQAQATSETDEKVGIADDEPQLEAGHADSVADEITKMNEEVAEWKDKYLRLTAEYDNYRKRTRHEMEELRKTAGEKIIKDILGTVDDFERAMQALQSIDDAAGLDGVKLIYDKFMGMLKSKGVEVIDRGGEDFDTDFEEAITKFPAPDPSLKGKVIEVVQKGYTLHGKVIRFAKVVVGE